MTRSTVFLLSLPALLISSEMFVFWLAARWLGIEAGYLAGFAVYWLFWCLLIPWLVTGKKPLTDLLAERAALVSRRNWLPTLTWLTVIVAALFIYGRDFISASPLLIAAAIPLAIVNGVCEEMLWRGLYVRQFPENFGWECSTHRWDLPSGISPR